MSTEDTAEEEGNWKHTGSNPPTCKSKYQLLQDAFIGPTLPPKEEKKKKKNKILLSGAPPPAQLNTQMFESYIKPRQETQV